MLKFEHTQAHSKCLAELAKKHVFVVVQQRSALNVFCARTEGTRNNNSLGARGTEYYVDTYAANAFM